MPYHFFDHTGDVGVRLSGGTPAHLFAAAADAFTETITESPRVTTRAEIPIALESSALDLLLVDFLNELLYQFDVRQFLVAKADVHVTGGGESASRGADPAAGERSYRLLGVLRGEPFDPSRHAIKVLVKAVTYHALDVAEDAGGWQATVIFDI